MRTQSRSRKKTDEDDERQVENKALVSSLDNATAETDESPLVEDGAASTASNEEPTLFTQKTDKKEEGKPSFSGDAEEKESQGDEDGEPLASDDSPEINESSSTAPSSDNDPLADTLAKDLVEDNVKSMLVLCSMLVSQ